MTTKDSDRKKKILLVTNIPNPYRIPLFNQINKKLSELNYDFKVIFGAKGYARRKWDVDLMDCKFDYKILNSKKVKFCQVEKTMFLYSGIVKEVLSWKPNIIVVGGFSVATLKIVLLSIFIKYKIIIWSGSIKKKGRNDSFVRIVYRKILKSRANAFVAYGKKAKEYLISLGVPEEKIQIAINTVDTEYFYLTAEQIKTQSIDNKSLKHLTYVGHLEPRKNVIRILEVVLILSKKRNDFVLDIIGDGSDRNKLEKFVNDNDLINIVRFHGFRQKHELPYYLASSSCFLFQTDFDIWGLVLNEAMAAGIPCISSINAGATFDLIIEGQTGFVLDYVNIEKVVDKVFWILEHPNESRRIGTNASEFIKKNVTLEKSADGFICSLRSVNS